MNYDEITEMLRRKWSIDGTLQQLPGEMDKNYAVLIDGVVTHILKIMHPGCDPSWIDMQVEALEHLARVDPELPLPRVVRSEDGRAVVSLPQTEDKGQLAWVITRVPGRLMSSIRPLSVDHMAAIGQSLARVLRALETFDHWGLDLTMKWDLRRAGEFLTATNQLVEVADQCRVENILKEFNEQYRGALNSLPATPIHNDANDNNILIDMNGKAGSVSAGLIDFGDMIRAPVVCELAIAGAYAVLDQERPLELLSALVKAFHAVRRLTKEEVDLIYPLLLTRLAVSVVNSAIEKLARPDDHYVVVSEAPALRFLRQSIPVFLAKARLRDACGYPVAAGRERIENWLLNDGLPAPIVQNLVPAEAPILDIGVTGDCAPSDPIELDHTDFSQRLKAAIGASSFAIGRYGEPRLIYTESAFRAARHPASERRTIHLGLDIFMAEGTAVHTPYEAIVRHVGVAPDRLDYGGFVRLEHRTLTGDKFFSFYGHLAQDVVNNLTPGQVLPKGVAFAKIGTHEENGGWPPHLHLQIGQTELEMVEHWPGVAHADDWPICKQLFPNPAMVLGLPVEDCEATIIDTSQLYTRRRENFSPNVILSYSKPLTLLRGYKQYLFDEYGTLYLDAYNNVPHVGHSHPRIVSTIGKQSRMIATNTRYLHPLQVEFSEALLSKFPECLNVCFLVNSASEANELAIRLAKAKTGRTDVIAMEGGYHGHTNAAIDISEYKFNGPGGSGAPEWVSVVPLPDPYRGTFKGLSVETGRRYAQFVGETVERLRSAGRAPAAFICETFPSVGGQVVLPPGYLAAAYDAVRSAGGICIADEVQTGLGRLGAYFWGFETQGVEPDVVVLGKPLGNGYPIAAVITTRSIAEAFSNGMEFFSTFGGNTLSCAIGLDVLTITDDELLADNAKRVGDFLLHALRDMSKRFSLIGDVRGMGLFIGVDLVEDQQSRTPATLKTRYIVNRLRDKRILIGSDGKKDNVLKVRPPLCFSMDDAEKFIENLELVLAEDMCRAN